MENNPIIVEKIFTVPVSKLWKVISDKDEMKIWYFDLDEFIPEVGFTFQFSGGPSPEKQYLHICQITEVQPMQKLAYSWRYDGYSGSSMVSFELFEENEGTMLRLTHSGLDTFPAENEDLARGNFVEGWNQIINHSLKNYLEGKV